MTAVIAIGAVSAFGVGPDAYRLEQPGEPARTAIAEDAFLRDGGLKRPRVARAPAELGVRTGDRAADILCAAFDQVTVELDRTLPDWRTRRIGVCIGTSSGGMLPAEQLFRCRAEKLAPQRDAWVSATYFAPLDLALARVDLHPMKTSQVLAACASSTIAIGLGMRWLQRDACDIVLVGGYDGVSLFVAAGFEALRATSASMPQPFRRTRDGMCLGEGAAVLAIAPETAHPLFFVRGFGASSDAVHITAPDRGGAGLERAMTAACRDASMRSDDIAVISAHGTSTPYNDAAEAAAIGRVCGLPTPVVHPFKAQIGHTLGAAGVLETLAMADAMTRGVAPAARGEGDVDPDARVTLLSRAVERTMRDGLKLSAAFGGVTASLAVSTEPGPQRVDRARAVSVVAHAAVTDVDRAELARATGVPRAKLARIDDLGQLALGALAALVAQCGREAIAGAGVVAGYGLATLDTNERFHRRLLDKGPRWVDPRLFPATSPSSGAGHCAIAFGLTGPNFAVNGGLAGSLEALVAAAELIAAGDCDRMVVVASDDAGSAAVDWVATVCPEREHRRGAVAVLLEASSDGTSIDLDMAVPHEDGPIGHLALLRWLGS